jgi:hypothetical protein
MKNNLDEQQTKIYSVLIEKFEKFAEQQIAIALRVIQVRLPAIATHVK